MRMLHSLPHMGGPVFLSRQRMSTILTIQPDAAGTGRGRGTTRIGITRTEITRTGTIRTGIIETGIEATGIDVVNEMTTSGHPVNATMTIIGRVGTTSTSHRPQGDMKMGIGAVRGSIVGTMSVINIARGIETGIGTETVEGKEIETGRKRRKGGNTLTPHR